MENFLLGSRDKILYEGPHLDLNAETRTVLSITMVIWNYISYQNRYDKLIIFHWENLTSQRQMG